MISTNTILWFKIILSATCLPNVIVFSYYKMNHLRSFLSVYLFLWLTISLMADKNAFLGWKLDDIYFLTDIICYYLGYYLFKYKTSRVMYSLDVFSLSILLLLSIGSYYSFLLNCIYYSVGYLFCFWNVIPQKNTEEDPLLSQKEPMLSEMV